MKVKLTDPAFLDVVVIRFGISSEDENYHVPLIISPFAIPLTAGVETTNREAMVVLDCLRCVSVCRHA